MSEPTDSEVIEAMKHYGGSFVIHLGEAAMYADRDHLARIKRGFPEIWQRYTELAKKRKKLEQAK